MCGQFSDTICVIENLVVIVGRFVPWDILSLGRFLSGTYSLRTFGPLVRFVLGRFVCAPSLIILIRSIGTAVMYNFVIFFEELICASYST